MGRCGDMKAIEFGSGNAECGKGKIKNKDKSAKMEGEWLGKGKDRKVGKWEAMEFGKRNAEFGRGEKRAESK
jgi:hypothetical protein